MSYEYKLKLISNDPNRIEQLASQMKWRLNEGKFDLLGRIYAGIGEPICWALGNFVSDKQISKYNLTHWRRA